MQIQPLKWIFLLIGKHSLCIRAAVSITFFLSIYVLQACNDTTAASWADF